MKVIPLILLVTIILLLAATSVFASEILLKKEYDKMDKSYLYIIDVKTYLFAKYGF